MKIDRRTLLKGVLGSGVVTIGLPMLEVFMNTNGTALAQGEGFAPRFGLFFWGNGTLPDKWVPSGEGDTWQLSEQMQPLAAVQDRLTVVSGTELKVPNLIPHTSGASGILAGAPLIMNGESSTFGGPTLDVLIANEIGNDTRFRSIEYGAAPGGGRSFNGPNSQNPAESSPYALFERIFGAGFRAPGETTEVDPKIALRRSVLDAVMEDSRRLQSKVSANDRIRLEQHFDGIRELETRLARLEEDPPNRAACARPDAPELAYPDIDGRAQLTAKNRAMCDIMAMALACDQSRVFSNYFTYPVNNLLFEGATAGHHQLTHDEPGDQPQVNAIVLQIMTEFAYMVESLSAVPEGDGTLLDNCIVLATSDVSYGRTHNLDEFPIILSGTAGGAIKQGVHYRSTSAENSARVVLTLMRALGINAEGFGVDMGRATESIGALES